MLGRGATVPILCYCVGGFSNSNDERQVKVSSKQLTMQLKAEEELHILQTIPGHAGWMYQGSAEGGSGIITSKTGIMQSEKIHIWLQQRNGRKSWTLVENLPIKYNLQKVLKALKKSYCCNGFVKTSQVAGKHPFLQLQGDHRKRLKSFLVENGMADQEHIHVHGFD